MSEGKKNWKLKEPKDWEKQLDCLPYHIERKLLAVLADLSTLEDPTAFGVFEKNLKYGSAYVLRLDKSYRLSYQVDFREHVIILCRVGDHKAVGSKE